jgi:hypothetical protein
LLDWLGLKPRKASDFFDFSRESGAWHLGRIGASEQEDDGESEGRVED